MVDDTKTQRLHWQDFGRPRRRVQRASGSHRRQTRPIQGAQGARSPDGDVILTAKTNGAPSGYRTRPRPDMSSTTRRRASSHCPQAMVFAEPDSPVYLQPAFDMAAVMLENQPHKSNLRSAPAWNAMGQSVAVPVLHHRTLVSPGGSKHSRRFVAADLDGVAAKLESGAKVADVGCGHGFSTIIMAKAFPKSTSSAIDFHPDSVAQARVHAEQQHGATANTKFGVAMASDFPDKDLDLVTFFDCLHDMGDPVGASAPCAPDVEAGRRSWMIVEAID